jgi:hypothetical protein
MRMAGRMGNERVSIQNLKVVSVDLENNIIYIQGAVPGSIDALLEIKGRGELVIKAAKSEKEAVATEQSVAEDIKEENKEVEEIKTEAVKEEVKTEEVKTEEKAEEKKENTEDLKQD